MELAKTRASPIDGCAHGLAMPTQDARAGGETEQRLYVISAWGEAPFYGGRAALALLSNRTASVNSFTPSMAGGARQGRGIARNG